MPTKTIKALPLSIDPKIPENAVISANEGYLYRAFDNVIRNAINYSPEGSTIQTHIGQDGKTGLSMLPTMGQA